MWRDGWERGGGVPTMSLASLGGPDAGVGTRICFCLDGDGLTLFTRPLRALVDGEGEIVRSDPGRRVDYRIGFAFMTLSRSIRLEAQGAGRTRVRWIEDATVGNVLFRPLLWAARSSIGGFEGVIRSAGRLATS